MAVVRRDEEGAQSVVLLNVVPPVVRGSEVAGTEFKRPRHPTCCQESDPHKDL